MLIVDIFDAYFQEFFLLVDEASVVDGDLLTWVSILEHLSRIFVSLSFA